MKKAISAQKTRMYLENPDAPAAATGLLKGGSKSKPCVVIFDSVSQLRNGAAVFVIGTGFASIDGQSWVVQNIDQEAKSATLANTDTSGETGDWGANAAWVLRSYIDLCVASYQISQNAAAEIDTTTLCDDEKTSLVGFGDPGTFTCDFFPNPTDEDYLALRAAQQDGKARILEIIYRNKAVRTLPVIVQSLNESGGVDQAVQGSATFKVTGKDVLTQPPGQTTENYVLIPIAAPATGQMPLQVTLTLNEAGGTATQFVIDWRDGSPKQTTSSHQASHSYTAPGTYQPVVVATIEGSLSAPFKCQGVVTVQAPPYSCTASIAPTSGKAPLAATLTITETNGPATQFAVDWGDGSAVETILTPTAQHTYAEMGVYQAKVTPTAYGTVQASVFAPDVTVTSPASITSNITTNNAAADGVATNSVSFTVLDGNSAPLAGVNLSFASGSPAGTAAIAPLTGITAADGTFAVTVTDTTAETVTVTATAVDAPTVTGSVDVVFTPPV
ncbi:Ig-like domain-containing protein [Paraburkholderia silvatlantica]|uniref:Ig-like domain-containing protein n=1 Tax=Paraburkholderia silvatlantica TaxID=321895 RepID=UPI00375366B6